MRICEEKLKGERGKVRVVESAFLDSL